MSAHPTPLLSACLIVKDEADVIARCLATLQGVVDEVVVLDTGSTDDTATIARAMGATVHHGEWHDDFARARNEALSRCRGRWALVVDADEELLVDDPAALRRRLEHGSATAYTVQIDNVEDATGAVRVSHAATRLFRRRLHVFRGRIHENAVPRSGPASIPPEIAEVAIRHHGYVEEVFTGRDKATRNVRLAEAALADDPHDVNRLHLARSLTTHPTDAERALPHLEQLLDSPIADVRRTAGPMGAQVHLRLGRPEEALRWLDRHEEVDAPTALSRQIRAQALSATGRHEEALAVIESGAEDDLSGMPGFTLSRTPGQALRGRLLAALGREDEAIEVLLECAPDADVDLWTILLALLSQRDEVHRAGPAFLAGLARGEARAQAVMAELSRQPVALGEALCREIAVLEGGLPYAIAFVVLNAERLDVEQAALWGRIAREHGAADRCPLLIQADAFTLPARDRAIAAALAAGMGDDRGRASLRRACALLPDEEVPAVLYAVDELAPDALPDLATGFVTSQRRATVLAGALADAGAVEQAHAVLEYGLEECAGDPVSTDALQAAKADLELLLAG